VSRKAVAASLLLAVVGSSIPARGDGTKDAEGDIRRLAAQVSEIAGKQQGVLDRMDLLKRRLRLGEMMLARVQGEQAAAGAAVNEASARLEAFSQKESEALHYLRVRMRQLYTLGVLQQYRLLFAVSSTQDLRAAGFYLNVLGERDAEAFRRLSQVRDGQARVRAELEASQRNLELQASEAIRERSAIGSEQADLSAVLARLGEARQTAQQGLEETLAAARAMDRYVTDLSFRARVEMMTKDMAQGRGQLPHPCEGGVLRGFGDFVHPKFKTRVPHPGLDIGAPLGTPVAAVFDGQVEYAGWLSGYGYTVILSHPGGFFTIYGHLDQTAAKKGDSLAQGQALGAVGENAALGTTALYFELRQGAKAVDPSNWLKGGARVPESGGD
jgi:septal ring factor EnvC (AmiA/AmiB activator)